MEEYKPSANFSQTSKDLLPQKLDIELNAIARAVRGLADAVENQPTPSSEAPEINPATEWAAEANYKPGDMVFKGMAMLRARQKHKSGDFNEDFARGYWMTIFDLQPIFARMEQTALNPQVLAAGDATGAIEKVAAKLDLIETATQNVDVLAKAGAAADMMAELYKRATMLTALAEELPNLTKIASQLVEIRVLAANLDGVFNSVKTVSETVKKAENAADRAHQGANRGRATSQTRLEIGFGIKSMEIEKGKDFDPGQHVRIVNAADPKNWMAGLITDYTNGALTFITEAINGEGVFADWKLFVSAQPGAPGRTADQVVLNLKN